MNGGKLYCPCWRWTGSGCGWGKQRMTMSLLMEAEKSNRRHMLRQVWDPLPDQQGVLDARQNKRSCKTMVEWLWRQQILSGVPKVFLQSIEGQIVQVTATKVTEEIGVIQVLSGSAAGREDDLEVIIKRPWQSASKADRSCYRAVAANIPWNGQGAYQTRIRFLWCSYWPGVSVAGKGKNWFKVMPCCGQLDGNLLVPFGTPSCSSFSD